VIPNKVTDSENLNSLMQTIINTNGIAIRNSLYVTHPSDLAAPIGFVKQDADKTNLDKVLSNQSVIADQKPNGYINPDLSNPVVIHHYKTWSYLSRNCLANSALNW